MGVLSGKLIVWTAKGWGGSSVCFDIVEAELQYCDGHAGVMLIERGVSGEDAR